MNKILYLESDEEIISIIDRLRGLGDKKVALVIPSGAVLFNSSMNLRLLYEEGKSLGKELAIVTTDVAGRSIASQVGFTVYENLGEVREAKSRDIEEREKEIVAKKRVLKKSQEDLEEDILDVDKDGFYTDIKGADGKAEDDSEDGVSSRDTEGASSEKDFFISEEPHKKKRVFKNTKSIFSRGPKFWATAIASFILVIFLLVFVFPKATIYLSVYASEQKIDINFRVSAESQSVEKAEKTILPAKWEEAEKEVSIEVDATGEKNVGDKARGTATIFNRSGNAVNLVANSELVTGDGKVFIIPASITVPGAFVSSFGEMVWGKISVNIEAAKAGEAYNIKPTKLYIVSLNETMGNLVYGQIDAELAGGSDKIAKVVSKEDIELAKRKVQEEIDGQLEKEFGMKGEKVFVKGLGTTEIISENFSKKEDEEAEKLKITTRAKLSFLAFNKKDFDAMFNDSLKMYLSDQKELVGSLYRSVDWRVVNFDSKKKEGEVVASTTVLTAAKINQEALKSSITSLSQQELRVFLTKYPDVELDRVKFFPPILLASIPSNERNIKIVIRHPEK